MFDYIDKSRHRSSSTRWATAAVSAIGHVVLLIALAIPALYATDALPTPKETMAFFVSTAPPPPPPPPAPVPAAPKTVPTKAARVAPQKPVPQQPRVVAAAPVEAPAEITPESGFEGIASSNAAQQAGVEYGVPGGVAGGIVGGFESAPPPPPPPVPAPRAPVRVGGEITAPRLLHRVEPEYPLLAQRALIQGVVILEATVDRGGRVDEIRVLRSHSLLDDAAVTAVRQWVYEPLMLNGQPQPFVLTVTLSFSLPTER